MTITFHPNEDIFNSECKYLVVPVNCVGIAGKGLAYQFRQKFPHWHNSYVEACDRDFIRPGKILIYDYEEPHIVNFPTKIHWSNKSNIDWIVTGIATLMGVLQELPPSSIAIPLLGCGEGGLDIDLVKTIIIAGVQALPSWEVKIYG